MLPYSQLAGTTGKALLRDVAAVIDVIDNKGGTNPERRTEQQRWELTLPGENAIVNRIVHFFQDLE